MQTLAEIKSLLAQRGLAPRKRLGQNFLTDHNLIRRLVDTAGVGEGNTVLEVGPGTGTMTEELLDRGCRVVACELDAGFASMLRERFGGQRFLLVEGDCLAGKRSVNPALFDAIGEEPFTLVANLPYGAATPLMLGLLAEPRCGGQFVTIQKEVADRLVAAPGSKVYGAISVASQVLGRVERIATLPRECFWPRPEVTSAMVSIVPHRAGAGGVSGLPSGLDPRAFAEFCVEVFAGRRKQLGSVLGDGAWPDGVARTDRAESLTPEQILALFTCRRGAVG